jgi:SAM-dependent methyltransferase
MSSPKIPFLDPVTKADPNARIYNAPAVAEYYATLNYLTPCEQLLFKEYLKPAMAILDLGVGGGRTTPYLSSIASHYVGIDYAAEMIVRCRKKFPHLEFEVENADDLSRFTASRFDAVVFPFNGIDYLIRDETRFRALREVERVLKIDGILILSSHNPRSIWVRPSWNPKRVQDLVASILKNNSLLFRPLFLSLTAVRVVVGCIQALLQSAARAARRLLTRAFWRGQGYLTDPAHGGLLTHYSVPEKMIAELGRFGFRLVRILGDDFPCVSHRYITDWYYYVFVKTGAMKE